MKTTEVSVYYCFKFNIEVHTVIIIQ